MNWRHWMGLTPTEAGFARHLLSIAEQAGHTNWRYEAADSTLRSGDQVVNLGNLYLEYSRASRSGRAGFREKYRAILAPPKTGQVTALWSVAQTHLYPLLRSRYERVAIDIQHRGKEPMPARAAKSFLGNMDIVIGYDHDHTVTQVQGIRARRVGCHPRYGPRPRERQSTGAPTATLGIRRTRPLVPRITRRLSRFLPPITETV